MFSILTRQRKRRSAYQISFPFLPLIHVLSLKCLQIHLGPSEYLIEISGTVGPFTYAPHGVITSLTLVTTIRTYGLYGELVGNPFHIPMQNKGGSIVGFFARVGWYVDAFGIYVNPNLGATQEDEVFLLYSSSTTTTNNDDDEQVSVLTFN